MISAQELQGSWKTIRGKLKEKWGQLTDDDLEFASGNVDELMGAIQRRTGATRRHIETFVQNTLDEGRGMRDAIMSSAHDVADRAREEYDHMSERVRGGYRRAEEMVQEYPASSVSGAFVCGLVTGVFVGLLLSSNR